MGKFTPRIANPLQQSHISSNLSIVCHCLGSLDFECLRKEVKFLWGVGTKRAGPFVSKSEEFAAARPFPESNRRRLPLGTITYS